MVGTETIPSEYLPHSVGSRSNVSITSLEHPYDGYRVDLTPLPDGPDPLDGWFTCRATLMHFSGELMGKPATLPLTWYVGKPTDWASGQARFFNPWSRIVFIVTARRSA